jgi:ADP-ribose pyrophosphatase
MTETVYRWKGPPEIRLERQQVQHGSRRWLQHRLVLSGGADGAVIIAESDQGVLLVRQFRPAVGEELWELPRGLAESQDAGADSTVSAVNTAARELLEETGHTLTGARWLGHLWTDSGVLATGVSVVHGYVVDVDPEARRDGEIDEYQWVPPPALVRMVSAGEVRDGLSVAGLGLWWSLGSGGGPPGSSTHPRSARS